MNGFVVQGHIFTLLSDFDNLCHKGYQSSSATSQIYIQCINFVLL